MEIHRTTGRRVSTATTARSRLRGIALPCGVVQLSTNSAGNDTESTPPILPQAVLHKAVGSLSSQAVKPLLTPG